MPRKKHTTVEAEPLEQPGAQPQARAVAEGEPGGAATTTKPRARSFRTTLNLPAKGVALGVRDGHDWVVTFPADPGKETKDQLGDAGFEYHDRKWRVFTHAANRPAVVALVKELTDRNGDEITVNEYPVKQIVLAFDAPPGEEITGQLRDADFHFRSDRTWNAEYTPQNQQFARNFIQSLPAINRAAGASR